MSLFYKSIVTSVAVLIFAGAGCSSKKEIDVTRYTSLERVAPVDYPEFRDTLSASSDLIRAVRMSLVYYGRIPGDRLFYFNGDAYPADHLKRSLEVFVSFMETDPEPSAVEAFIKERFLVYQTTGKPLEDADRVLFTGYYEPTVRGSLTPSDTYRYPLYPEPSDKLRIDLSAFSDKYRDEPTLTARVNEKRQVVPYYTREEINSHPAFEDVSTPIAWLDSRTDRFFLEIQGSGRIVLEDGKVIRVHYHGKNGHPYRSIGRYLIDKGEIDREAMSMQAIRAWLERNPDRAEEVFHYNPSFVFFKTEEGGPYGSIGVEVTPLRSIATDRSLFPNGALCFMETSLPEDRHDLSDSGWQRVSGFVLNQDTGGAIKGPSRADLFCGNGEYAEFAAGHLQHTGKLFFLVLRPSEAK